MSRNIQKFRTDKQPRKQTQNRKRKNARKEKQQRRNNAYLSMIGR